MPFLLPKCFLNTLCRKDFLDYEVVFPKKLTLKSTDKNEILDNILPVRDQLYQEWRENVLTEKRKL